MINLFASIIIIISTAIIIGSAALRYAEVKG